MENNLEIGIQQLLEKMKNRIADDAQSISMLQVTVDVYSAKLAEAERRLVEMEKQIAILREMQEQQ